MGNARAACRINAKTSIQACAGVIRDSKQRHAGSTLVVWGGELRPARSIRKAGNSRHQNEAAIIIALIHDVGWPRRRLQARHNIRRNRRLS